MKEHSILFAPDMAAAVRDGRQTQTRRVVIPQPDFPIPAVIHWRQNTDGLWDAHNDLGNICIGPARLRCPYGVPGDMLRMLTTWAVHRQYDDLKPTQLPGNIDAVWTAFDANPKPDSFGKLRPGRFCTLAIRKRWMPLAENVDVRVERVQDITKTHNRDIEAEGFPNDGTPPLKWFGDLWDSINHKRGYGWDVNPLVYAVTFRRTEP